MLHLFPTELLFEVANHLQPSDLFALVLTSRKLHACLIGRLNRLALTYQVSSPLSLTHGLRDVTFWFDKQGNGSVLEWTVIYNRDTAFRTLLEQRGIDMVQSDSYGVTLLHRLASQGLVAFMRPLIEKLIKAGLNIDQTDHSQLTPLHVAAGCAHKGAVRLLIEKGASVSAQDYHGNTPLHIAATAGSAQVFSSLIKAGADANAEARFGWLAVDMASISHHEAAVYELLALGSRPPSWQSRRYALNEYVRLSPCPKEYCYSGLESVFNEET